MRHTLITGANRGIGLGFARHHLAAGERVTACCRDPDGAAALQTLAAGSPDRLRIAQLDLTRDADLSALAASLADARASLDRVISNAGVSHEQAFGAIDPAAVRETFDVNGVGPLLLAQALLPFIAAGGQLVHLSSGLASIESAPRSGPVYDAYAMSKAGINMLTRRLAKPLAEQGITVVAISPGWVQTDMGGANADLTVDASVSSMSRTLDALPPGQSGAYLDHDGTPLPW